MQTEVLPQASPVAPVFDRRRDVRPTSQLRSLLPLFAVWLVGGSLFAWLISRDHIADEELLLDPAALTGSAWYTGMISSFGILLWTVATVSAAAAGFVSRLGGRDRAARFLVQATALSALLTLDDLFQLHSSVLPEALGTGKAVVLALYLALATSWILTNIGELARTRYVLLAFAGLAFAMSIVIDQTGRGGLRLEDACKFLGILAWTTYFALTATDIARSVVNLPRTEDMAQDSAISAQR